MFDRFLRTTAIGIIIIIIIVEQTRTLVRGPLLRVRHCWLSKNRTKTNIYVGGPVSVGAKRVFVSERKM